MQLYRGWDRFEETDTDVIDFDLSGVRGRASFRSRDEVLNALLRLRDQLDEILENPSEVALLDAEFLLARVEGSISYLQARMGGQILFPEYLESTLAIHKETALGIQPAAFSDLKFSDEDIAAAHKAASEQLFDILGLAMRPQQRPRFEQEFMIRDRDTIRDGIVGDQELWLSRLREQGIQVPDQVPLSVQFDEVDAYWSNWIAGSKQKGITLTINLHSRRKYDKGRLLALCLHEICGHAAQMSIWEDRISHRQINEACGVTTVHSPEAVVCEGLGQTVADFLAEDLKCESALHLSRALQYYNLLVLHNAHLMLYEHIPVKKVLEYAVDQLPLMDPLDVERELHDRGVDPLYRSYQLTYAIGEKTIRDLIRRFSTQQKRELFRQIYTTPMTHRHLLATAARIRGNIGFDGNIQAREATDAARVEC